MKDLVFGILITFLLLATSCMDKEKQIVVDGYKLKGQIKIIKSDTIFEGPIEYYDSSSRLVERTQFRENKRDGKSIFYYPNGQIEQTTAFVDGYKNGETITYDSSGKIAQKTYSYLSLDVGPVEFYKNDSLKVYQFSNFEGYPIYRATYDSAKGLLESGRLLYYISKFSDDDDRRRIKVFLYLISPPGKSLTYKIFDTDSSKKDTSLVNIFKADKQVFTTFYLDVPLANHKYFFEIEAFYSNNGRRVKNILNPEDCEFVMPGAHQ